MAWRTLSEVGRTRPSRGATSPRPPIVPPVMRIASPQFTDGNYSTASPSRECHAATLAPRLTPGYDQVMMRRIWLLLLLVAAAFAPASAQIDQLPKVHARFVSEHDGVASGGTVTVALEENIRPGWHTYWSNPGDAGEPTEIKWSLPPGWRADAIQWPYPQREPVGPLMDYGYEGKVWLLVDLHAPADVKPGDVAKLSAAVQWLVCAEVCVPEDTTLALTLYVDATPPAPDAVTAEQFASARAKIPAASPWPMRFALANDLKLYVKAPALASTARPVAAAFFPAQSGEVKDAAAQTLDFADDGIVLVLQPGAGAAKFRASGRRSGSHLRRQIGAGIAGSCRARRGAARPAAVAVKSVSHWRYFWLLSAA